LCGRPVFTSRQSRGYLLDELVVVGGLVPSLLIPEKSVPRGEDIHVGTMDLDLGLSLALLDAERDKKRRFRHDESL